MRLGPQFQATALCIGQSAPVTRTGVTHRRRTSHVAANGRRQARREWFRIAREAKRAGDTYMARMLRLDARGI